MHRILAAGRSVLAGVNINVWDVTDTIAALVRAPRSRSTGRSSSTQTCPGPGRRCPSDGSITMTAPMTARQLDLADARASITRHRAQRRRLGDSSNRSGAVPNV